MPFIHRITILLYENDFLYLNDDKQSDKNIIKEGAGAMLETIPEILTLIQCQELLHIGRTTILNMIKQEEIKAFKVRGRWRIQKRGFGRNIWQKRQILNE